MEDFCKALEKELPHTKVEQHRDNINHSTVISVIDLITREKFNVGISEISLSGRYIEEYLVRYSKELISKVLTNRGIHLGKTWRATSPYSSMSFDDWDGLPLSKPGKVTSPRAVPKPAPKKTPKKETVNYNIIKQFGIF